MNIMNPELHRILLKNLDDLSNMAGAALKYISKATKEKQQSDIEFGSIKTFSKAELQQLPLMTKTKVASALAKLEAEGVTFRRDEGKLTRPWMYTFEDIYNIYQAVGIKSRYQRLQEDGKSELTPVVGVVNLKGGVGKSTSLATIATGLTTCRNYLSEQIRVLIIDLDPQGTTSLIFGYDGLSQHLSISDLISTIANGEQLGDPEKFISKTSTYGIDIIPANTSDAFFSITANDYAEKMGCSTTELLSHVIEYIKKNSNYDLILLDCGPHIDQMLLNILQCSTGLMIPVGLTTVEFDSSLKYIAKLGGLFKLIPEPNLYFEKVRVLPSLYDQRDPIHNQNHSLLMKVMGANMLNTQLMRLMPYSQTMSSHQTVFTISPKFFNEVGSKRQLQLAKANAESIVAQFFITYLG